LRSTGQWQWKITLHNFRKSLDTVFDPHIIIYEKPIGCPPHPAGFSFFNNIAAAILMIVFYDATGVRRQAGMHVERINRTINEIFTSQPISEKELREVLGHTPRQVVAGVFLGVDIALIVWVAFQYFPKINQVGGIKIESFLEKI